MSGRNKRGTGSLTGVVAGICGISALLVAAILVSLLVSVVQLRREDTDARRASDLLTESSHAEGSVVDVETGLRGFLLTGQRRFLAPYEQARRQLPAELSDVRRLAAKGPERKEVERLAGAIATYVHSYAEPLAASPGALSSRQKIAVAARGKQLLDSLRARFQSLATYDLRLRSARRAQARRQTDRAVVIAVIGAVLSIVLFVALGVYLVRRVLWPIRQVSRGARRVAESEKGVRVPAVGLGEIAQLGQAFNEMASQLEARDEELVRTQEQLRSAAAEANQASEMKSNFLANMSHEIRTPLNGVVGMVDLLSGTQLDAEQREFVAMAESSSHALMTVIDDVLDIAKIEAGRLELDHRDFNLPELAETSCDMVAASALAKKLELQSFVHEDVPTIVRGDRARLSQILTNLLSNAVKFTAEGEVVLEVSMVSRSSSSAEVGFTIRDTGIGVAADRLSALFEPFTQAEAGTTRAYGGTGLGLAIVRELAEMMGGRVSAESTPGVGSTFTCVIPFELSTTDRPRQPPRAGLRGLQVLVVDDMATNRRIFEAYVTSWGMRPVLAADASEAMQKLTRAARRGDPIDVALLDLNMPGVSGLDLARRIRRSSTLSATRLILLSSSGVIRAEQDGTGIELMLTKPIRQSRLLDAISRVVGSEAADLPDADGAVSTADQSRGPSCRAVLVAEDQPVNWKLVERMLARHRHTVVNATNGREAVELMERQQFDLVLMDCQMPLMDGYAATREIRRREGESPDARHVPIVAMTANALQGDRVRCLEAGMDDYLAKPLTSEDIDTVLARWLPASPSIIPPIDTARLDGLRELFSREELTEILHGLREDVERQLDLIATAATRQDHAALKAAAHSILNSARMIGAAALADEASRAELDAELGPAQMMDQEGRLRAAWEQVREALSELDPGAEEPAPEPR